MISKKSFIIIVIVGVVFVIAGIVLSGMNSTNKVTVNEENQAQENESQKENAVETSPSETETIIQYTDKGFSPETVTIKKGGVVMFKNESKQSMWPASASHPTHATYPTKGGCLGSTFDACGEIVPGNSWSFKFDVTGTWNYHDHKRASNRGVVIVEE